MRRSSLPSTLDERPRPILVFSIVNRAVVALRESDAPFYEPSFTAPGYPYVQAFGVVSGLALLTRMGPIPILGASGIVAGGVAWYLFYGRSRTDRVGALGVLVRHRRGADGDPDRVEPR